MRRNLILTAGLTAALFLFTLPLAAYAYVGTFTRYWAGEYCFAVVQRDEGIFGAVRWWYERWPGFFGESVSLSILTAIGPESWPFIAGATILIWCFIAFWAVRQVSILAFGEASAWRTAVLALAAVATFFMILPDRVRSFYWIEGLTNYTLPPVLLTALIAVIAGSVLAPRRYPLVLSGPVFFAIAFMAAGLEETVVASLIVFLVLAGSATFALASRTVRSTLLPLFGSGLAGTLLATIIVVLAPGYDAHQDRLGTELPWLNVAWECLKATAVFVAHFATRLPTLLLFLLACLLTLSSVRERPADVTSEIQRLIIAAGVTIGLAWLIIAANYAPAERYFSAYPLPRHLANAVFVFVVATIVLGYLAGRFAATAIDLSTLRQTTSHPLAFLALPIVTFAVIIGPVRDELSQRDTLAAYAAAYDEREAMIHRARDAGQKTVTVPLLHRKGIDADWSFASTDDPEMELVPDYSGTDCAARLYGVEALEFEQSPALDP